MTNHVQYAVVVERAGSTEYIGLFDNKTDADVWASKRMGDNEFKVVTMINRYQWR